jgi:hypothetical protein
MIRSLTSMLARQLIRWHTFRADCCYCELRQLMNDTMRTGQMDAIDEVVAVDLSRRHRRHLSKAEWWSAFLESKQVCV